jgi:hypothetical protein
MKEKCGGRDSSKEGSKNQEDDKCHCHEVVDELENFHLVIR